MKKSRKEKEVKFQKGLKIKEEMKGKNKNSIKNFKNNKKLFWIIIILVLILIIGVLALIQFTGYAVSGGLCEDSDAEEYAGVYPRGDNIFVEGRVTRASIERVDYCIPLDEDPEGKNLREYYCQNSGLISTKLVECPSGKCENGACV